MSKDKQLDDSPKGLDIENTKEKLDDSNTLHEQLKKIKEDSSKGTEEFKDIDKPIFEYCS